MSKLAVFVEGYTEVLFVEKLVSEIFDEQDIRIEHREIRGGTNARRTFAQMRAAKPDEGQQYFVLIVDCGGDHQVKSRIMEEHENLTKAGYTGIIGLRDVRPDFSHADVPRLEAGLRLYIKTSLAPVEFILAVLEIEAWYLAEATHFPKIDPRITVAAIVAAFGFDPSTEDMALRPTPREDLDRCYGLGGKAYSKSSSDTVNALDFAEVYLALPPRYAHLQRLIGAIERFLP